MARMTNDKACDQPNQETIAAMKEAVQIEQDPSVMSFINLDKLFDELENEEKREMD